MSFPRRLAVPLAALVLAVTACSSDQNGSPATSGPAVQSSEATAPTTGAPSSPPASTFPDQPDAPAKQYYVSLGDSYAAGYQPSVNGSESGASTVGFPYQVVTDAKAKGYDYQLVNFACSGATSTSIISASGCESRFLSAGGTDYSPLTQAAAAEQFLRGHRGQVGLVTISIGGNDVVPCGAQSDAIACVTSAVQGLQTNLTTLLSGLRDAAGPDVRIVGTTYPDVFLGNLLSSDAAAQQLGRLSVQVFQIGLNPTLRNIYAAAGALFVDVTQATGGYGPLTAETTLAPYGRIPVPVAQVCRYTWYCEVRDIHPKPIGHALIARLVVGTLPAH